MPKTYAKNRHRKRFANWMTSADAWLLRSAISRGDLCKRAVHGKRSGAFCLAAILRKTWGRTAFDQGQRRWPLHVRLRSQVRAAKAAGPESGSCATRGSPSRCRSLLAQRPLLRHGFSKPDQQHLCRNQNGWQPDYAFSNCAKNY